MKTSQALYDVIEAAYRLEKAMDEDYDDLNHPDIKPEGVLWIINHRIKAIGARQVFEDIRDSLNEVE